VADPGWANPLDGGFAAERGGRWNPPESFPVVYLCGSVEVARANVYRKLEGQPYGPEDLIPASGPVLVRASVPDDRYLNAVTEAGLRDLGLPKSYPRDSRRRRIPWRRCQPIGLRAWEAGLPGVAARSAAASSGEELAYFGRRRLRRGIRRAFHDWFWTDAPLR
jgi:RES domain-containing protein